MPSHGRRIELVWEYGAYSDEYCFGKRYVVTHFLVGYHVLWYEKEIIVTLCNLIVYKSVILNTHRSWMEVGNEVSSHGK